MIRIITDSTSDISREEAKQLNIEIIPLRVFFGDEVFRDGVDLSHGEFYEKLSKAEKLPATSQITPDEAISVFEPFLKNGDDIVGIFISSRLSGSVQSALIAAKTLGGSIHIVDSLNATIGLSLLVRIAVKLRDDGFSAAEISAEIEKLKHKVILNAAVDTLKYLKMGGRLSGASAFAGELLGIIPIISITDGSVICTGKVRGRDAVIKHLSQKLSGNMPDRNYPVIAAHSNRPEALKRLRDGIGDTLAGYSIIDSSIGCIVGTHIGPGGYGYAYIKSDA